ncbi:hypothetical protein M758_1G034800 [Ceratodon purpureus]|nr:hypothetical protein M758_1G034800 [Ceratodon purpureus]
MYCSCMTWVVLLTWDGTAPAPAPALLPPTSPSLLPSGPCLQHSIQCVFSVVLGMVLQLMK